MSSNQKLYNELMEQIAPVVKRMINEAIEQDVVPIYHNETWNGNVELLYSQMPFNTTEDGIIKVTMIKSDKNDGSYYVKRNPFIGLAPYEVNKQYDTLLANFQDNRKNVENQVNLFMKSVKQNHLFVGLLPPVKFKSKSPIRTGLVIFRKNDGKKLRDTVKSVTKDTIMDEFDLLLDKYNEANDLNLGFNDIICKFRLYE